MGAEETAREARERRERLAQRAQEEAAILAENEQARPAPLRKFLSQRRTGEATAVRTAGATAARLRIGQETKAAALRDAGWLVVPPEDAPALRGVLDAARAYVARFRQRGSRPSATALFAAVDAYETRKGPDGQPDA